MSNGLTEEMILERGIIKNVPRVLDDSEDREDAGHWLNTAGRRVYSTDRVELAEEMLMDRCNEYFVNPQAAEINSSCRPFTPAIFIFDYRTLVSEVDPDLESSICRERLSHPAVGRFPGSNDRETKLIKEALLAIARYGFPAESFRSFAGVEKYLKKVALTAHEKLSPAWPHILVRQPILRSNLSRGKSPKAARRILRLLSLLQTGRLSHNLISEEPLTLVELLSKAPTLRIDHKVLDSDPSKMEDS